MNTLNFALAEKRQFEFAYQTLLFPRKELNEQEEIGLRNLLVDFEQVGVPKPLRMADGDVEAFTISADVEVEIEDERDFRLLNTLVKGAVVNGLWVRDKLALLEKLEEAGKKKDG